MALNCFSFRACSYSYNNYSMLMLTLPICVMLMMMKSCHGLGQFGFNIHHRFSDPIKGILPVDGLPEKGSRAYYVAMAHRDGLIHGRKLATSPKAAPPILTFYGGNDTYFLSRLGYLHYANVSVGTPSSSYLVALDTGSDVFWIPCDCTSTSSCITGIKTADGELIKLNIYSLDSSTTSRSVPCSSTLCPSSQTSSCPSRAATCPYQVRYLSVNTSSTGFLVEDVLHLVTDDVQMKAVDANITFGCGKVQTGIFLEGAAPNGLLGLGMDQIAVPSVLAGQGLILDSFSMCFGADGLGRIDFGDEGTSDQSETPFNIKNTQFPTYYISVAGIEVGAIAKNIDFTAIFDSGTSFTYLNDPSYTFITSKFDSEIQEKRYNDSDIPFEYCYQLSPDQTTLSHPIVSLSMGGGAQYRVFDPLIFFATTDKTYVFCLAVLKSEDINLIGQNFMTGYRIVFDRVKMVLAWKESNCYGDKSNHSTKYYSPPPPPSTPSTPKYYNPPPPIFAVTSVPPPPAGGNNTPATPQVTVPISRSDHAVSQLNIFTASALFNFICLLVLAFA